jgi:hypothetical protein
MAERSAGAVRDVADFHLRWAEFRPAAEAAAQSSALPADQREIVSWLIRLADRVGESDVVPRQGPRRPRRRC